MNVNVGTPVVQGLALATAVSTGSTQNLGTVRVKHAMQTTVSGTVATLTVLLEGSLDGTTFYTLATTTNIAGEVQYVVDKPAQYVRSRVTVISGAGATVNAFIGSA